MTSHTVTPPTLRLYDGACVGGNAMQDVNTEPAVKTHTDLLNVGKGRGRGQHLVRGMRSSVT